MEEKYKELSNLYSELPPIPCKACGKCCVSPSCTFIEFLYLMNGILEKLGQDATRDFLLKEPEVHPGYEGNLYCRFQDREKGLCLVHFSRTMACRIFGLPAISDLGISELENCKEMDVKTLPTVEQTKLSTWLNKLSSINKEISTFYKEPYWLAGLNVECWLAVYFNPLLDDDVFGEYKKLMHKYIDLSFLKKEYVDKTELKEKTEKIILLNHLISFGEIKKTPSVIESIKNEYSLTGTYFLDELAEIEKII